MSTLPSTQSSSLLDFLDDVPPNIKTELRNRYDELTRLELEQTQEGTVVPQLYGSLSRFIANPSTVSVETYKRIIDTDETVGAGIDFLNLALIARFGEYKHPVKEIQEFVRRALGQMEGSWHENLDEMFSAEWAGFSATEQIWDYNNSFDGAPAFIPRKLVTYPPLTIVFAVNRHGEVLHDGVYQYQRFHNTFFNSYMGVVNQELDGFRPDLYASIGDYPYPVRIAADLTYLTVKIPKHKMILLRSSSTGKFANPYGRSILRRAYKNWVMKDAFLHMWLVAADRKGTPLVVGYAAPNETLMTQTTADGRVDQGLGRADLAMSNIFSKIHNSSFIVLPGRKGEIYDVEAIQVQGDMNIYKDGIDYFNRALMRSLLIPPLVMSAGDGAGSFALGNEHHKIFQQTIDGKLKVYKQSILDQFIKKIIAYNFPKHYWEKHGCGEFLLEEYDPEVMEKLSNIYRNLTETGYMAPNSQQDFDYVREKMGMLKTKNDQNFSEENTLGEDADTDNNEPINVSTPNSPDQSVQENIGTITPSENALNGAQVSSLIEVIEKAALKEIPRSSAVAIIMSSFSMTEDQANAILGDESFVPATQTPTQPTNKPVPNAIPPKSVANKIPKGKVSKAPSKGNNVKTDPESAEGSEPNKQPSSDTEDQLPPNYRI